MALLLLNNVAQTQQIIHLYPEDKCVEHVSYGAFLPADINMNQDVQTRKTLAKYRLEFTVDKGTSPQDDTVRVVLTNKGSEPVELAVGTTGKSLKGCETQGSDYYVWTGEQAEISLIRLSFYGEQKWIDPGERLVFIVHLKKEGMYKFGLLTGNDAYGDAGLIVTPAFEVKAR